MNGRNAIWYAQGVDNSGLERGRKEARRIWDQMGSDAEGTGIKVQKLWGNVGRTIGLSLAGISIGGFAKKMFEVRASFQDAESAMTLFLGSADKARNFLKELQEYAWHNAFEFSDLVEQSKQLLAYGNSVESVIPILDKLSNVAVATKQPLGNLVDLYDKAKNIGSIDSVGLKQWAAAGLVITDVLDEMGLQVDRSSVKFEHLEMVLDKVTGEGGRFHKQMETMMPNLSMSLGQLQDDITNMFNELGEKTEGVMKGAIEFGSTLVANYEKIGKAILGLIATYGAYRVALALTTAAEKGWTISQLAHYKSLVLVDKAQKILNATMLKNPYVLVAVALVGLVSTMWALRDSTTAAERAQERFNDKQAEFNQNQDEKRQKVEQLIQTIQSETETEYNRIRAYDELIAKSRALAAAYDLEAVKTLDLADAVKILNDERDKESYNNLLTELRNSSQELEKLQAQRDKWYNAPIISMGGIALDKEIKELQADVERYQEEIRKSKNQLKQSRPVEMRLAEAQADLEQIESEFRKAEKKLLEEKERIDNQGFGFIPIQVQIDFAVKQEGLNKAMNYVSLLRNEAEKKEEKPILNKEYWEERKKENQALLDKMDNSLSGTSAWKELEKKIIEADKNIKLYSPSGPSEKSLNQSAERIKKYQDDYAKGVIESDRNLEAARIALMKDNDRKRFAQAELDFQRELDRIDREEKDKLDAYNKYLKEGGKQIDGREGEIATAADESRILAEQTLLNSIEEINKESAERIKAVRTEVANSFANDLQKEESRIEAHFQKLVESAEGDIALISEIQMAWINELAKAKQSADLQLLSFNEEIELAELEHLQNSLGMTEYYETKKLEAQKKYLEQRIELLEAAGDQESQQEAKRLSVSLKGVDSKLSLPASLKEIADGKAFNAIQKHFKKMGKSQEEAEESTEALFEAFKKGGAQASEALNAVNSVIGGVDEGLDAALDAVGSIAEGFASGGLVGGIAAAAGQLISITTSMIGAKREIDQTMKARYEDYVKLLSEFIDRQISMLDKLGGDKFGANIQKTAEDIANSISAARTMFEEASKAGSSVGSHSYGSRANKILKSNANELKKYGIHQSDITKMTDEQLIKLREIQTVYVQLPSEIREYIDAIAEGTQKMEDFRETVQDTILGFNFSDITTMIVDSMTDPSIDDALGSLEEKINDSLGNILKNQLARKMLLEPIQKMVDQLFDSIDKGNNVYELDTDFAKGFIDQILGLGGEFQQAWDTLNKQFEDAGVNLNGQGDSSRTSVAKGFATASQDSIDKLDGIFTNIQNHTYNLNKNVEIMAVDTSAIKESFRITVQNCAEILNHVAGIHQNTDRLEAIETSLRSIKHGITEMNDSGLFMKK